jgi:hypothetical protein
MLRSVSVQEGERKGRRGVIKKKKKIQVIGDQGKPGEPGHRSIGRGSCRSALADGVDRESNAGPQQWY